MVAAFEHFAQADLLAGGGCQGEDGGGVRCHAVGCTSILIAV
jgi:hypothetical protein